MHVAIAGIRPASLNAKGNEGMPTPMAVDASVQMDEAIVAALLPALHRQVPLEYCFD